MNICCDCHKPYLTGVNLLMDGEDRPICNNCYERLKQEIGEAIYAESGAETNAIMKQYAAAGHSDIVARGMSDLYFQAKFGGLTHLTLQLVNNGQVIGMRKASGKVIMRQDHTNGQVFFDSNPRIRFYLEGLGWNGPAYKEVSVSQSSGGVKSKEKSKRKGGIVGAAAGGILLGPVGAGIGYAATNKKVTKGKTKDNTRVVTETQSVEKDGTAVLKLRNVVDNKIYTLGIVCNSEIGLDLERFDWNVRSNTIYADAEVVTEVEVLKEPEPQQLTGTSESDIISLLKEYKDLMDSGIITEEEFNKKKKELLG